MEATELGLDFLTVTQAAQEAGVTQAAIRNAIYEGKLAARQMLGRHVIARGQFDVYLSNRRRRGRPTKPDAQSPAETPKASENGK